MFAYCSGIGQTVPLSAKAGFCAGKGIMTARGWRVRPFLAKVHRYAGLGMALFLIVSGLTGALLAFYHELDQALNPGLFRVQERRTAALGPDALVAAVQKAYPNTQVSFLALHRADRESVHVRLSPGNQSADGKPNVPDIDEVYLDPYDGRILGGRQTDALRADRIHLMPFLYGLHRSMHLPERWGVWLMGLVALTWMFDCLVGVYLTLPSYRNPKTSACRTVGYSTERNWRQRWKPAWLIKRGAGAPRLNFDLHRAGGLWLWGMLFTLAMSGAYFNLAQEVFRPVVSLFGTLSPNPVQALPKRSGVQPAPQLSFEAAIERARTLLPEQARGMQPDFVGYMPAQGVYRVGFQEQGRGESAFILGFEQVFVDADTSQLRGRRGYGSGTPSDKFLAWQFPLHSGQVLGLPGRIVVCITGLATVMLSITGVLIWNRKRKSRGRAAQPVSR
ncbi:putative iron-regulated membrane protein [Methylobacter tundripaludum]|uniref:Putative iron-regulated membrane protein n=2 Tax=Methylobacter tundripaludum TaxID=173365 RepID=A0A2S6H6I3_9GAMM|nr:putative iron-regulated membrane protein [Methylobacter tundripaludum]